MKIKMLNPDVSRDGKVVFNFVDVENPKEPISIISEITGTKAEMKAAAKVAKTVAITEAKTILKDKADKKGKRESVIAALADAGIIGEEFDVE